MIRRYLPIPKDLEQLIQWYERYISPFSLIAGFVADNLILLRRVDLWQSNALLFSYIAVATTGIILLNAIEAGRIRGERMRIIAPIIPVVVQFAFGGLFSGFVSLYSRSASFFGTWIFIAVLAALLIGNERFRKLYLRFSFQIALYFSSVFLFFIFLLPVLFHRIGDAVFILSGLTAIGVTASLLFVLSHISPVVEQKERTQSARSIALIWLVVTILYFTNLIPPLPLALKDAGVYHAVSRNTDGTYTLEGESSAWYQTIFPIRSQFHRAPGDTAYVFTAIFAPTGLSTTILHEWQHYDEAASKWITKSTFTFTINGGRDGGYRGYTLKSSPEIGKWRVNVITPSGLFIGRVSFTVTDEPATEDRVATMH